MAEQALTQVDVVPVDAITVVFYGAEQRIGACPDAHGAKAKEGLVEREGRVGA